MTVKSIGIIVQTEKTVDCVLKKNSHIGMRCRYTFILIKENWYTKRYCFRSNLLRNFLCFQYLSSYNIKYQFNICNVCNFVAIWKKVIKCSQITFKLKIPFYLFVSQHGKNTNQFESQFENTLKFHSKPKPHSSSTKLRTITDTQNYFNLLWNPNVYYSIAILNG